jgi:hypothetical protein
MTNKFLMRSAILSSALTLALAAVPGRSIANDAKVMGGTACRRASTGTMLGLQYTTDGVVNVSGQSMQVICSILRDNTGNTNGLAGLQVGVTDTTSGGIACDAVADDPKGNPVIVTRKSSTKLGAQVLDFGTTVSKSAAKGYYSLNCSLPNGAKISSIYSNEY